MGWDPVPYMIGNGARHSESVMRLVEHHASSGNEGILTASDLKVTALATPAGQVQVAVGSCSILGRGASQVAEMYAARMQTIDAAAIAATGAGAGRSDLIIARIEDPNIAGSQWNQPASVADGPYVFTRVISGVPNTTRTVAELNLGYTAIALARIDVPVSTSSITQAMIIDLRRLANPKRDPRLYTINPSAAAELTATSIGDWFGNVSVDIPLWATKVIMVVHVEGARHSRNSSSSSGTANGTIRGALGTMYTQVAKYDVETTSSNNVSRVSLGAGDTISVPAALRGTTQTLRIQGTRDGGNQPISVTDSSFATIQIEFQESAV